MEKISNILKRYINEHIPKKATNIFWQMFNGIEVSFVALENKLEIFKRERNILTAKNLASLRNLSAQNGFEPSLKIPSTGILTMQINSKLFNRVGYPLFLPPYAIFTNTTTKLTYFYNSNKTLRIDKNIIKIPVVEGEIKQQLFKGIGNTIERIYLTDLNIANNSISVNVNGVEFLEVKSFPDNININNNKQFVVKYSIDFSKPIVLYIKGITVNDSIQVTYKITNGERGNMLSTYFFETDDLIDNNGIEIAADADEITIVNIDGFDLGSNGTDETTLRSAIGYNHGINLLFDNSSYRNFIGKYSTLMIQNIIVDDNNKTINNIYISKKQSLYTPSNTSDSYLISLYKNIIENQSYLVPLNEKINLTGTLSEFEYALSSHNLYDSKTCKFGLQIIFNNQNEKDLYKNDVELLLYKEFGKFLYDKNNILNIEILFKTFMKTNNISFEYNIFNQIDEEEKIKNKTEIITSYIIKHDTYLPLLKGDFVICDSDFSTVNLFNDINFVTKA